MPSCADHVDEWIPDDRRHGEQVEADNERDPDGDDVGFGSGTQHRRADTGQHELDPDDNAEGLAGVFVKRCALAPVAGIVAFIAGRGAWLDAR